MGFLLGLFAVGFIIFATVCALSGEPQNASVKSMSCII